MNYPRFHQVSRTLILCQFQSPAGKTMLVDAGDTDAGSRIVADLKARGIPSEVFPMRVKVKPLPDISEPVLFKPLVPALSFIKNKVMWSGSIRGAMRTIPEEDYQRIVAGAPEWGISGSSLRPDHHRGW